MVEAAPIEKSSATPRAAGMPNTVNVYANSKPTANKFTMSMRAILDLKAGDYIDFLFKPLHGTLTTFGTVGGVYDDSNHYYALYWSLARGKC